MGRTPGWMILVATTLEVCTLAFLDYLTESDATPQTQAPRAAGTAGEPPPVDEPPPRPLIVEPPHFKLPVADTVAVDDEPVPIPPVPSVAPVTSSEVPRFLLDVADRTAQIMRAESRLGTDYAGFYPDGSVRFVGCDGVGYEGRSENAVADLIEYGGIKSIRMQVGVSPESKLQITVHGGLHDGETLQLEMITERLPR